MTMFLQQLPPFNISEGDMSSVEICWCKYVSRFENFLLAMNIIQEPRKQALLLHYGGFELQDIYESFVDTGNTYETLKTAFTNYFAQKTNKLFEIWSFQKTMQIIEEPLQAYYLHVREKAARCNFDDQNKGIKTQLILGMNSQKLYRYCFTNKEATLQDKLVCGKLLEDIDFQLREMEEEVEIEPKEAEEVQVLHQQAAGLQF